MGITFPGSTDVTCLHGPRRYQVLEMLGQGTFGQVVKCVESGTGRLVAVKVIKNKPNYTKQAKLEIKVLREVRWLIVHGYILASLMTCPCSWSKCAV